MLVVEDDPATYSALLGILTFKGFDAQIAASLERARELLSAQPQYVILDLMLPDGSGRELLRELRRTGFGGRIIVTTGAADPQLLSEVQELKPDAVLRKPVSLADLLRALQHPAN